MGDTFTDAPVLDAKVPYDQRLRNCTEISQRSFPAASAKYAWVHLCCYLWVRSDLEKRSPKNLLQNCVLQLTGPMLKGLVQNSSKACDICRSPHGLKVSCSANPIELISRGEKKPGQLQHDVTCDVVVHPECARKAHFNLCLDFREILCSKHRTELRLLMIERYEAIRRKEITDFAENLEQCYKYITQKDSIEAQALA